MKNVWDLCEGIPRVLFEHLNLEGMEEKLLQKLAIVDCAVVESMMEHDIPFCLFKFVVVEGST